MNNSGEKKEAFRLAIVVMVEQNNLSLEQLMAIKTAIETIKRRRR